MGHAWVTEDEVGTEWVTHTLQRMCLLLLQLLWSFVFGICFVMQFEVSFFSFAIILLRKRELVALLWLCSCCHFGVCVLCLFLVVP